MNQVEDRRMVYKYGIAGAIMTVVGTLLSGPLAFLAVSKIHPQPGWSGPQTYVDNFHPIQTISFYFGFLLLLGSLLMISVLYVLNNKDLRSLLAVIFTSIACGLISFNYFTQAAYIPAVVRNYESSLAPVINIFSVTNPISIFWAIEMWGYGFLGLGTLFVAGFFMNQGIEKITKILFWVNGFISMVGALYTSINLEWVLSTAGLISYALWNLLYIILAIYFLMTMFRRLKTLKN